MEIALDEGVGIGTMVRNAFARADDIHARAWMPEGSSTADPEQSQAHSETSGDIHNWQGDDGDGYISVPGTSFSSARDVDLNSMPSRNLPTESSESAPTDGLEAHGEGGGSDIQSNAGESGGRSSDNMNLENDSDDSTAEEDWGSADDESSDGDLLEELLGQIPHDRQGSNPDFDVAATLPLYEGSALSMLCATLLIVNCCKTHGVSNMFINELLMLLSMSILPQGNCLPKTEYEASKILRKLGLAYNLIHACPKGCCLFKGDLEDVEKCPVCDNDRYRMCGRSRVPTMILRHFPLIPQLQRMFSSRKLSRLNVWHYFHKSRDGKMRHTADSPQWDFVHNQLEPEAGHNAFGRDPRHVHLGIALDGMNPFSEKRSTQSLTPVIVFNYNLPPWMVTKKYFVMLTLLIPTKLSLTGLNFDVFIQPLVDELQQLWSRAGVPTRDARAYLGMPVFNLRAVVMWTLHDFPAYGLISGLQTKGFKGCPVCGPNTISRRSKILRKNVFCSCHRRYLREGHYFRAADAAFDGLPNHETEPEPLTGNQTIRRGKESEAHIDGGGTEKDEEYPAKLHGVKRVSAMFQLPYWRVSSHLKLSHLFWLFNFLHITCSYPHVPRFCLPYLQTHLHSNWNGYATVPYRFCMHHLLDQILETLPRN